VKSSIKDNENDVKLIEQSISSVDNNIFNINQKLNEISEAKIKISEYGNIEEKVIEINKKYTLFVDKYNEYLHVVDKCNSVDDNISTNYKFLGKLNEEIKEIEQKEKEILEYADYIFEREKKQGELKDIERKASFASTGPLAGFGLTPGERKVEPIIRESVAKFEGPTRQRVKLLEEQRKQIHYSNSNWLEELSTGEK